MSHEYGKYAHATTVTPGARQVIRGGVIRLTDTGPELHVNGTHQSHGILPNSVKINASGDLEFRLDKALPVVTLWANADETLVSRGIAAGISGGGSLCVVRLHRADQPVGEKLDLRTVGHYGRVKGSTSNIWVGVVSHYDR